MQNKTMTVLQEHKNAVGPHTIHVYTGGPAGGSTYFFVHGIGVSSRYFIPLMTELATSNRVVAIDLPGFGKSSRPEELLTIPDLAWVVAEVIKQEHILNPVLVGHSMGCQVIAEVLKQNAHIVTKAVLLAPTINAQLRSVIAHVFLLAQDCLREPWGVNKVVVQDYLRCGLRRYLQTLGPMMADHIEEKFEHSTAKVLVVRGERDAIVPHDWAVQLTEVIPQATLAEVPGAAHVVQVARLQDIARICREFVDTTKG